MEELQQFLLDSINIAIDERLRELQYDITLQGKVISMNEDRTKCTIELFGQRAEAEITHGVIVVPNDMVLIKMPAGDYNNKLIVGKVGTSAFGGSGPGGSYLGIDFDHVDLENSGTMSHVEIDSAMSEMYTSLRFEGVATEKVSLNSSVVLTAPFTLSYWVKPARMNAYFPINGTDVSVTPIRHITDTQFSIGGAAPFVISEGIISNQWNNITLVKNISNEISFYKNGRLVYEGTHTGNLSFNQIGGTTVGSGWIEYKGNIRQIKVWNTNLSVEAIQYELNSNDMMMLTGNAVQHWKIGEAQGTAIYNSISGNDGAVTLAYWQGPGTNLETSNLPLSIKIGREGIKATKGADTMFWLKDTGDAEFAGELKAATGTFLGKVTITNDTEFAIDFNSQLALGLGDLAYDNVVEMAKLGTTIIEGAYIKTGLIDAARIDTGVLNAARVSIGPNSQYSAGYNPTEKETPAGSQAKVTALQNTLGSLAYDSAVELAKLGTTIIDGGFIATGLVNASRIDTGTLNAARVSIGSDTVFAEGYNPITKASEDYVTGEIELFSETIIEGGFIKTGLIDADVLVVKYLKTAVTGERISINELGNENDILFYSSGGTVAAKLDYYTGVNTPFASPEGFRIATTGNHVLKLESNTAMSLGASGDIWVYTNNLQLARVGSKIVFPDATELSSAVLKFG